VSLLMCFPDNGFSSVLLCCLPMHCVAFFCGKNYMIATCFYQLLAVINKQISLALLFMWAIESSNSSSISSRGAIVYNTNPCLKQPEKIRLYSYIFYCFFSFNQWLPAILSSPTGPPNNFSIIREQQLANP